MGSDIKMKSGFSLRQMSRRSLEILRNPSQFQVIHLTDLFTCASELLSDLSEHISLNLLGYREYHSGQDYQDFVQIPRYRWLQVQEVLWVLWARYARCPLHCHWWWHWQQHPIVRQ